MTDLNKVKEFLINNPGYLKKSPYKLSERLAIDSDICYLALKDTKLSLKNKVQSNKPQPKVLIYDLEVSYNIVKSWRVGYNLNINPSDIIEERKIICVSYKWLGEDQIYNIQWDKNHNDNTIIRPDEIPEEEPGRYILNITEADWEYTRNKPTFATVALSGSYNDLDNKLTAGLGILMNSNELTVDGSKFMSVPVANAAIASMQTQIDTKTPVVRTITINGITQDLESNRTWEVGNVSTTNTYSNPSFIGSLAYSKLTGTPSIPTILSKVFNNNVTRTLNSNYTISTTRDSQVNYSLTLSVTNPLLVGSSSATVFLEYSIDSGTSWVTISQVSNSSSVGITVTVAITLPNTFVLTGSIPSNALVRLRSVLTGTSSVTYIRGQEILN